MRTAAPPLLPIFRSELQARALARLLDSQDRSWTVSELAAELGRPVPSVHREVVRLAEAGILRSERRGAARYVEPNPEWPHLAELRRLVLGTTGAPRVLAHALADVPGIVSAAIFGSWAARYHGQPGESPADIDLLVIGEPDTAAVYAGARAAEGELGRPVDVTILSPAEWAQRRSGFLRTVARSELVPVIGEAP
jgi:hypothetical protein